MSVNFSFLEWLNNHLKEQGKRPCDFAAARASLRVLREIAIHAGTTKEFFEMEDELDVLENYVYDRATPQELDEALKK